MSTIEFSPTDRLVDTATSRDLNTVLRLPAISSSETTSPILGASILIALFFLAFNEFVNSATSSILVKRPVSVLLLSLSVFPK